VIVYKSRTHARALGYLSYRYPLDIFGFIQNLGGGLQNPVFRVLIVHKPS
jgi:hypothetical protein